MNPGTLQTICQIVFAIGIVVTGLAGFGSYYYGKKDTAVMQQTIISKLDQSLKSTDSENKTQLLKKYPAGYVLFGIDSSGTFSNSVFPHGKDVLSEYEFDWSSVKIEKLTSSSLTILLPNIHYKPLNTQCIGVTITISRKPLGKEYIFPVKPNGTLHRIYIELLKDDNQQLIFVIGFRKINT